LNLAETMLNYVESDMFEIWPSWPWPNSGQLR